MLMEQATTVRKEWSAVCDSVIHNKPKFIKRTRDKMWFSNLETMSIFVLHISLLQRSTRKMITL